MDQTEQSVSALTPPYDPKTIFLEEWARIVPAHFEGTGREGAWKDVQGFRPPATLAFAIVPESTYRGFCRSVVHGWVAIEAKQIAKEADEQARALQTIYGHELKALCGEICGVLDAAGALLRYCDHPENHGTDGKPRAKTAAARELAVLLEAISKPTTLRELVDQLRSASEES